MAEKHSPEPWLLYGSLVCSRVTGEPVCGTSASPAGAQEANAARIVACVNACKGINPEAVPAMLSAIETVLRDEAWAEDCGNPDDELRFHLVRGAYLKAKEGQP